jgi:hypothetical protein
MELMLGSTVWLIIEFTLTMTALIVPVAAVHGVLVRVRPPNQNLAALSANEVDVMRIPTVRAIRRALINLVARHTFDIEVVLLHVIVEACFRHVCLVAVFELT